MSCLSTPPQWPADIEASFMFLRGIIGAFPVSVTPRDEQQIIENVLIYIYISGDICGPNSNAIWSWSRNNNLIKQTFRNTYSSLYLTPTSEDEES